MKTIFISLLNALNIHSINFYDTHEEYFDSRKNYFFNKVVRLINNNHYTSALIGVDKKSILDNVLKNIGFSDDANIYNIPNPSDQILRYEVLSGYQRLTHTIQKQRFDSEKINLTTRIIRLINKASFIHDLTRTERNLIVKEVLEKIGFTKDANIYDVPNPSNRFVTLEVLSVYNNHFNLIEGYGAAA